MPSVSNSKGPTQQIDAPIAANTPAIKELFEFKIAINHFHNDYLNRSIDSVLEYGIKR